MNKGIKGFTLVELLVVMTILVILMIIMIGAFNPLAMVTRAIDSRRKKDLNRIRLSFEDYFNDKNCYPDQDVLDELLKEGNCKSDVFSPWINSWPCDPESRQPYVIVSERTDCPSWFKIYANLGNLNDTSIPEGWYDHDDFYLFGEGLSVDDANYGTSSTNVFWYDYGLAPWCELDKCWQKIISTGGCGPVSVPCVPDENKQCYLSRSCADGCKVYGCDP